jgi:3-hydroxyisobutyryl-CoA hydrolase
MMSISLTTLMTHQTEQSPILFETNLALRTYILNRPDKLNALDETMLNILRPQIEVIVLGSLT